MMQGTYMYIHGERVLNVDIYLIVVLIVEVYILTAEQMANFQ